MPIPSLRGESAGSMGESGPSLLHGTPVPRGGGEIRQGERGFPPVLRMPLCPQAWTQAQPSFLGLWAWELVRLGSFPIRETEGADRQRCYTSWAPSLSQVTRRRCFSNYFRPSRGWVAKDRRTRVRFQFRASRSFLMRDVAAGIYYNISANLCVLEQVT